MRFNGWPLPMNPPIPVVRRAVVSLVGAAAFATTVAHGAVITLVPGVQRTDDPVTGVSDWTLDAGILLPVLPAATGRVIFEAGGDGLGTALALIGSDLVVYQDQGDFNASSPADDTFFSLDVGSLAGRVVSLRLDADLAGASDRLTLSVFDGAATLSADAVLPLDGTSIAGGNDTALGGVAGDTAGLDESVEVGFPDFAQLNTAAYNVDAAQPIGENVLGVGLLAGTLYTAEDQPPADLPAPGSWGLIPEPAASILIGLAGFALILRRRRR